jgi:hypothetical protein
MPLDRERGELNFDRIALTLPIEIPKHDHGHQQAAKQKRSKIGSHARSFPGRMRPPALRRHTLPAKRRDGCSVPASHATRAGEEKDRSPPGRANASACGAGAVANVAKRCPPEVRTLAGTAQSSRSAKMHRARRRTVWPGSVTHPASWQMSTLWSSSAHEPERIDGGHACGQELQRSLPEHSSVSP